MIEYRRDQFLELKLESEPREFYSYRLQNNS